MNRARTLTARPTARVSADPCKDSENSLTMLCRVDALTREPLLVGLPQSCTEGELLCASDGQMYPNECAMNATALQKGIKLRKVHAGRCRRMGRFSIFFVCSSTSDFPRLLHPARQQCTKAFYYYIIYLCVLLSKRRDPVVTPAFGLDVSFNCTKTNISLPIMLCSRGCRKCASVYITLIETRLYLQRARFDSMLFFAFCSKEE